MIVSNGLTQKVSLRWQHVIVWGPALRTGTRSGAQSRQHISRPHSSPRPDVWVVVFLYLYKASQ